MHLSPFQRFDRLALVYDFQNSSYHSSRFLANRGFGNTQWIRQECVSEPFPETWSNCVSVSSCPIGYSIFHPLLFRGPRSAPCSRGRLPQDLVQDVLASMQVLVLAALQDFHQHNNLIRGTTSKQSRERIFQTSDKGGGGSLSYTLVSECCFQGGCCFQMSHLKLPQLKHDLFLQYMNFYKDSTHIKRNVMQRNLSRLRREKRN